ncbi:leucine-rich repeat protein [Anaerostipes sp.]|uniref:leucine-rich repeat protein n=1 Tax=Anaerostipes sp. TaxID=1872530 RepID=UPI0025B8097B|nr:leucine-rich repeat protein [Anaerostipes sp.]MBS7007068.1 leucine-rich repeat domain-containing protein [Anaerostipes sp.]
MKKRKGNFRKRMFALLLVAGIVSNSVSVCVPAQEGSGALQSVSGNSTEQAKEETEPVEETEPGETEKVVEDTAMAGQEDTEPETEEKMPENVSQNTAADETHAAESTEDIRVPAAAADAYKAARGRSTSKNYNTDTAIGGDCSKNGDGTLAWTFDSTAGTLTITGSGEMKDNACRPSGGCWYNYKDSIKSVVISGAVSIGMNAFYDCTNLESVTIPESVQTIDIAAFKSCSSLDNVTIPGSATITGFSVFADCSSLKTLTIQDGANITDSRVFENCTSLTKVTIPGSVQNIQKSTFEGCTSLESVTIADGVQTIGNSAFSDCKALTGITIPGSVTSIDWYAFNRCTSLAKVFFQGTDTIPAVDSSVFYSCPCVAGNTKGLIVPAGKLADYENKFESSLAPHITDGTYTVTVKEGTVSGGTGSANYTPGTTVTIKANAPAVGKQFDKWVVNSGSVTLASSTSSATTFIMPESAVTVTATYKDGHTHVYGKEWQKNGTQHWKTCSCGDEKDRADHDFGSWVTDQEATETVSGTRHRECQTCGYKETGTIPAAGTGTVTPEVKPGNNAPAASISTPKSELEEMLLTEEEKRQVQDGINIRIVLELKDAENTVSNSDKESMKQALNGFTVGQYLDIDLYKLVGKKRTDIAETPKKISIVMTVPESLRNRDSGRTRTFAVARVHNGRTEILNDVDSSPDTITIETDRFSTYAIVYKDASGNDDNGSHGSSTNNNSDNRDSSHNNSDKNGIKTDSAKDDVPKTGDYTSAELYAALAMIAGFACLLLYFSDRRRGISEETK